MVFPLIPLAIGGAVLIGGGLALNAKGRIKKANEKQKAAFGAYQRKCKSFESYKSETDRQLDSLAKTRIEGMKAIRQAIAFIQRAKLKNPNIISDAEVSMEKIVRAGPSVRKHPQNRRRHGCQRRRRTWRRWANRIGGLWPGRSLWSSVNRDCHRHLGRHGSKQRDSRMVWRRVLGRRGAGGSWRDGGSWWHYRRASCHRHRPI